MPPTAPADLGSVVERFDHLSVAVWDITAARRLVDLMGGEVKDGGDASAKGFRWIQFDLPGSCRLEMIQPLDRADSNNFLVRFLERHGEGVHHVTLKVSDIHQAIERAANAGFDVVGVDLAGANWKEAFLHPKSAHGVVIQLAEWVDLDDLPGLTVEHVAAGIPDRYV
ncbi:MAG TPA: VOC family protein [Acidimicrobiia bacterium]|jgi:methylmalonyl-CoA/ethylmalonyl-CoA epimerase